MLVLVPYASPPAITREAKRLLCRSACSIWQSRRSKNGSVTFARATYRHGPGKEHPVIWLLVMVLEISIAMAVGFVLGRIWQIRCDLEQERAGSFTPPPIARIPHP